jgi:hypothetical protein
LKNYISVIEGLSADRLLWNTIRLR